LIAALFSALHLLALGIGLGSVFLRGRALRSKTFDRDAIRRVLAADNVWGIAALLWIGTGLTRVLAGLDKGTDFYVHNGLFWVKMGQPWSHSCAGDWPSPAAARRLIRDRHSCVL